MVTAITNGKIYLGRDSFCEAVMIEDGVIRMVGTDAEVRAALPEGCKCIDAHGQTVIPGINDSHMHLMNVGVSLSLCDMNGARSISEIVERGRKFLAENPSAKEGFLCYGYNQDYFEDEKRLLTRKDLDRISETVPVVVKRVCGHTVTANSAALKRAGITSSTAPNEGGEIGMGPDGEPDGVFSESAIDQIMAIFPAPSFERREEMMRRAMDYAVSVGLTSVQSNDAYEDGADELFRLMKKLCDEGNLPLRYRHQITFTDEALLKNYIATEKNDPWYKDKPVTLGPLKLFKDGSLGARTALMRADYADDPGNRGVDVLSSERFSALCEIAAKGGMQVVTHAIGDAAVAETISHYEAVLEGKNELRHGVVHYQITDAGLHARMAESSILAFVQPIFLHYDLHIAESRVGKELARTSYAFSTLQKLGVPVSYGSDAPVEDPNPFRGLYCAVTRKDLSGFPAGGFYPEERVDIYDAVDCYTAGSSYAEFQEDIKGRIAPGYVADMIILDRDIFTIPPEEIPGTKVELTMVGGKIVYRRRPKDIVFENRYLGTKKMTLEFLTKLIYRNARLIYAIASFVWLLLLAYFLRTEQVLRSIITAALVLYFLGMGVATPYLALRRVKKNNMTVFNGKAYENVAKFGKNIALSTGTSSMTLEYSQIIRLIRLKHSIILQFGKKHHIMLDPDGFTLGDPAAFEAFLREKCPNLK